MKRILILQAEQRHRWQFRYKIDEVLDGDRRTVVDWQWGPFTREETIDQAKSRFGGFDSIEEAA